MSRGPGRVEQEIAAAFVAEPDGAFSTEDICKRAYRGANRIEKKHRVAVLRAMRNFVNRNPRFKLMYGDARGSTIIVYDGTRVLSLAAAREFHVISHHSEVRARMIRHGSVDLIEPGGVWWLWAEEHRAMVEGDEQRAADIGGELKVVRRIHLSRR